MSAFAWQTFRRTCAPPSSLGFGLTSGLRQGERQHPAGRNWWVQHSGCCGGGARPAPRVSGRRTHRHRHSAGGSRCWDALLPGLVQVHADGIHSIPPSPLNLRSPAESVNADEDHILCVLRPRYGIGCPNPASFKCALHAALTASSYADAVRQIILGGGDRFARPSRSTAYLSHHALISRIRYPAMPMSHCSMLCM